MDENGTLALAGDLLTGAWGQPVRLALVRDCVPWDGATNAVLLCEVEGSDGRRVVVKRSARPRGPLLRESAALEFLASLPDLKGLVPTVVAEDAAHEVVVLADMGFDEHHRLGRWLEEGGPEDAEAALIAQQRAVGRLQAATARRTGAFDALLAQRGEVRPSRHRVNIIADLVGDAATAADDPARGAELAVVERTLREPGPFLVLTHGDATPANAFWDGRRLMLFDFETARPGHALIDGAYAAIRYLFSVWASRFPAGVRERAFAAYREALAERIPEAADDRILRRELALAAAAWLVLLRARAVAVLEADRRWGNGTTRQRVVTAFDEFLAIEAAHEHLPAVTAWARSRLTYYRNLWPEADCTLRMHGAWQPSILPG